MGCTSGKQIKKKTTSVEDVSLQKGSAAQTNASSNKNGQIGKQNAAIQIPGANKSFLAPDGIPFIDEDVDDEGEQLNTTKHSDKTVAAEAHVGNATPGRVVIASTTTTTVPTNSSGSSALGGDCGDGAVTMIKTTSTTHHVDISGERKPIIDQILQKEARSTQHQEQSKAGRSSPEIANAENTSRQQEVAATKIQAGIRGFLDRKKVRAMRARQHQNHAGGKPDNNKHHPGGEGDGRHVLTDRAAIEVRYADAAADPQLNSAATKIQANYKGYKTRKQMKLKK